MNRRAWIAVRLVATAASSIATIYLWRTDGAWWLAALLGVAIAVVCRVFQTALERAAMLQTLWHYEGEQGLFGNDIVRLSNGGVGRSSIYTLLAEAVASGWVAEHVDGQRTRHKLTDAGRRARFQ